MQAPPTQLFLDQWPPPTYPHTLAHRGCLLIIHRRWAVRLGVSDLLKVIRSRQSSLHTSPHACSALTATPCTNEPVLQENRTRDKCMQDRLTATEALVITVIYWGLLGEDFSPLARRLQLASMIEEIVQSHAPLSFSSIATLKAGPTTLHALTAMPPNKKVAHLFNCTAPGPVRYVGGPPFLASLPQFANLPPLQINLHSFSSFLSHICSRPSAGPLSSSPLLFSA